MTEVFDVGSYFQDKMTGRVAFFATQVIGKVTPKYANVEAPSTAGFFLR